MRKQAKFYVILGMMSLMLSGCGQKEVVYDTESTTTVENSESSSEAPANATLKGELGIGEDATWKETIQMVGGSADFKTSITVPETQNMYTVTAKEYYLTSEDKKKIAEYFMDADSIRVDKDVSVTKESLQDRINMYEQAIAEGKYPKYQMIMPMDAYEQFVYSTFDYIQVPTDQEKASYEKEISRLTGLVNEAPAAADLDELSGDYVAEAYKGKKNDVEYAISFFHDETRNRSAWSLQAVDKNHFLQIDIKDDEFTCWELGAGIEDGFVPSNNLCQLTPEEAKEQAKKLCEDLGMYHMVPVTANPAQWDNGSVKELNGYLVRLVRQIEGVPVDFTTYLDDETYLDGENAMLPYSTECVEVCLNDKGIISVFCKGILKEEQMSEPVKLLGIDEVQEVFRQELKSETKGYIEGWQTLELSYVRVKNDEDPNQFTYIPAWRLRINATQAGFAMASTRHFVWINAIDGSRIDMDANGAPTLFYAYGLGDYE